MIPHETILFVAVLIAGFYMAWSIGANDVANAMGTSVGSGALTLKRAVMIAAVLEFSGAFFFGSHVSETVQKGIINPDIFANNPLWFVYGMLSSLVGVGIWLQLATWYGWPVSTTHSIVGALVGFGAFVGGVEAIYWENILFIVSSWILSPLFGGILGFLFFSLLRKQIFYSPMPLEAAKRAMPYFYFIVVSTLSLLFFFNGLENLHLEISLYYILGFCLLIGGIAYLISFFQVKKIKSILENPEYDQAKEEFNTIEKMFGTLQILSACLMAFAHGANDVANAIGPLSAAALVLKHGTVAVTAEVPTWALALGGAGIVLGLATWGWRVIETIGKKLTELTPTRGFAAEFAAALTILVASRLGMPISTTHTLVGAVVGVGLARGLEALNLNTTRDILLSWLITVPAGAAITMAVFWILTFLV